MAAATVVTMFTEVWQPKTHKVQFHQHVYVVEQLGIITLFNNEEKTSNCNIEIYMYTVTQKKCQKGIFIKWFIFICFMYISLIIKHYQWFMPICFLSFTSKRIIYYIWYNYRQLTTCLPDSHLSLINRMWIEGKRKVPLPCAVRILF